MSAAIIDIAEAVTAAINAQVWAPPYDYHLGAERLYEPVFTLADMAELKVSVVAAAVTGTLMARSKTRDQRYEIDIAFQQKLEAPADSVDTQETIGNLLALVEEIGDYLFDQGNLTGLSAIAIAINQEPLYDPERMKRSEFLSVVTITYQESR
jgi:hypothetical protein